MTGPDFVVPGLCALAAAGFGLVLFARPAALPAEVDPPVVEDFAIRTHRHGTLTDLEHDIVATRARMREQSAAIVATKRDVWPKPAPALPSAGDETRPAVVPDAVYERLPETVVRDEGSGSGGGALQ